MSLKKKRLKPKPDTKPIKVWRLELGPTFSKATVDKRIAQGYTHYEYPDRQKFKIQPVGYPCSGIKLEYLEATKQYMLVAVMEPGWVPTQTHK